MSSKIVLLHNTSKKNSYNDVMLLNETLMKIMKSNNIDDINDDKESIIDILNQLKDLPLVDADAVAIIIKKGTGSRSRNNNNKTEKMFMKLKKLNTCNVINELLDELLHKCRHVDRGGHVSKVDSKGESKVDDGEQDDKLYSSSRGNDEMKDDVSSNSINHQSNVRKTSRVVKNKVSTYNEDDLADQNIIPSTTINGSSTNGTNANKGHDMSIIEVSSINQPIPQKNKDGILIFPDYPQFKPNLTPKEILQLGSFGGTYFRIIKSGVTGQTYHDAWKEFPTDWYDGLNIKRHISSPTYDKSINYYKAKCGGDLHMWESSGWITAVDPFGWFQWYCRFYLGRRCSDDNRQVGRALGVMGETGRWRNNLINKCLSTSKPVEKVVDDVTIAPVVRQLLQHWGYRLTIKDLLKVKSKH